MTKAYALYLVTLTTLLGVGSISMFDITLASLAASPDSIDLGLYKVWLYSGDIMPLIGVLASAFYFTIVGGRFFVLFGRNIKTVYGGFVFGIISWLIVLGPLVLLLDNPTLTPSQLTIFVLMGTLWVYVFLTGMGRHIFGKYATLSLSEGFVSGLKFLCLGLVLPLVIVSNSLYEVVTSEAMIRSIRSVTMRAGLALLKLALILTSIFVCMEAFFILMDLYIQISPSSEFIADLLMGPFASAVILSTWFYVMLFTGISIWKGKRTFWF